MALETGDYINDAVITNPTATDPKSQGDDHLRNLKKWLKECLNGFAGGILLRATETGTASAHVLTPTTALVAYVTGQMLLYSPSNAGTGALTVNVSGLGAKSVKLINGADPTSGDVVINQPLLMVYDGTNFVCIGGSPYLMKTGAQTITGNTSITGSLAVSTTLAVTGASTFTGDIGGTGGNKKADKAGSVYTGTHDFSAATSVLVPAPTLAAQAVTKAYADGLSFAAALPAQAGNAGKAVITDGATASWGTLAALGGGTGQSSYTIGDILYASGATTLSKLAAGTSGFVLQAAGAGVAPAWAASGIKQITASATSITLTSTSTLAVMTPTTYGVSVTLQDPATDTPRDAYHAIDNKGAYPVRILNSAGTLLGFVLANNKCDAGLQTAGTPGTWSLSDYSLVGASALLISVNATIIDACIDIGSSQEVLIARGISSANIYGVVYNRSTNTFGSVTLIRTCTSGAGLVSACLSGTNQVLVCSVPTGAATFEAVALSISGTTITVNTAATATLSANISTFAASGLGGAVPVTGGVVVSYTVATPACELRGITISGTTVSLSAATTLTGTAGGLIVATGTSVIAASTATTHLYTKPYALSAGPTLTAGTGTDTNSGTMTLNFFAALGTRWAVLYNDGGTTGMGGVVSLSGTTTTITTATLLASSTILDAIVVGSNKVLVGGNQTTANVNILTDTAGTASAGTAITASAQTTRQFVYASGTNVVSQEGTSTYVINTIDCSGASPVLTSKQQTSNSVFAGFSVSNALLTRAATAVYGTAFTETINTVANSPAGLLEIAGASPIARAVPHNGRGSLMISSGATIYRGRLDSERWASDAVNLITKVECVA